MFSFTLLGTGAKRPTPQRGLASAFVHINGDRYLLNVPEGTQKELLRHSTGFKLNGLLLTDLRAQSLLGLPGLLSTLHSYARKGDESMRDFTIVAPAQTGAENRIQKFISLSTETISPQIQTAEADDIVVETGEYTIDAFSTKLSKGGLSVGYRIREHDRRGRFNREKAEELGVPVGPKFGKLHDGEPVELDDGRVIQPEDVVGESRPGRSFIYTGATEHTPGLADAVRGADVLVCDGGITSQDFSNQHPPNHLSAYQAGTIAENAEVSVLILTNIRDKYGPDANILKGDIEESFNGHSIIPKDGFSRDILTRDSFGRATHHSDVLSTQH